MIVVPFSPGASTQDFSSPQMIVNSLINANPGVISLSTETAGVNPFLDQDDRRGRVGTGIPLSNGSSFGRPSVPEREGE